MEIAHGLEPSRPVTRSYLCLVTNKFGVYAVVCLQSGMGMRYDAPADKHSFFGRSSYGASIRAPLPAYHHWRVAALLPRARAFGAPPHNQSSIVLGLYQQCHPQLLVSKLYRAISKTT
jgi:hypothetical protein